MWWRFRHASPFTWDDPPPPRPDSFTCRLPSVFPNLYFTARFTFSGNGDLRRSDPGRTVMARARGAIRDTAAALTRHRSPADPSGVEVEVNEAFAETTVLADRGVQWARCEIGAAEEDADRARAVESLHHEAALEEMRHRAALRRAALLRDEVFTTGGQARLWWVSRHPDQVERIAQVGTALDSVVEAVAAHSPPSTVDSVAAEAVAVVGELVHGLDETARARLAEVAVTQVRHLLTSFERDDLAERLDKAAASATPR